VRPRTRRFRGPLEEGHKGRAVIVPFDPEREWGLKPSKVLLETRGWAVRGTMNGAPFTGAIGLRWGRWFVRTDAALERAAGIAPGDLVDVVVEPVAAARPPRATTPRPRTRRS
jgi:hypothetical protein